MFEMPPTTRIELLPYVASAWSVTAARDDANPFDGGLLGRTGLDMKIGLGPNLTLDATVNPDFGQIEADPVEVNLTAFETFFDERRPFFLEGSRLLAGRESDEWSDDTEYFYSRRIGARPAGSAEGDFVDYPATTTTLGAAKVTGRLQTGISIGLLGAVSTAESARTFDVPSATLSRVQVGPWTSYGVGRMQQEFGPAGSTVAVMGTALHRGLGVDDGLASLLTRDAFSASGDSLLRFKEGEYELGLNLGVSHVAGEAPAIARIQRSSARYLQRPDRQHVT